MNKNCKGFKKLAVIPVKGKEQKAPLNKIKSKYGDACAYMHLHQKKKMNDEWKMSVRIEKNQNVQINERPYDLAFFT